MRPRKATRSDATKTRDMAVEPHSLLISVNDPRVCGSDVLYRVAIMDPARPRTAIHAVDRTFSQLKPIIAKMRLIAPDAGLPEVTKSKMFGTQQPEYMEARRESMELFLNAVCDNRMLCYETEFLEFVGFSEAAQERMARSALLLQMTSTPTLKAFIDALTERGQIADGEAELQAATSAARSWLRGRQDFSFIRVLGKVTHPSWVHKKMCVLVEDGSRRSHLLTIQPVVGERGFLKPSSVGGKGGEDSSVDRLKKVRQMISHFEKHGSVFVLPTVVDIVEHWMIAVCRVFPAGSLYDLVYDVRDPLSKGALKYAQPTKGLPAETMQQVAQGVLQLLRACHEHNIPTPTLTMGNILMEVDRATRKVNVALAGIEDILSGNTWLPFVPPLDGTDRIQECLQSEKSPLEDAGPRTNVDLLLFGSILYQCATGTMLNPRQLSALLSVQGDPFVPPVALPASAVSSVKHVFAPGADDTSLPQPHDVLPEILSLLHYLFHPTIAADIRILVHHSFLRMPSNEDGTPSGDGALSIRSKDIPIWESIGDQWVEMWGKQRAKKERIEQQWVDIKLGVPSELSVGEGMKRRRQEKATIRKKQQAESVFAPPPPPAPPPPAPVVTTPSTAPKAPDMPSMTPQSAPPPPPALSMEKSAPVPPAATPPPPKSPPPPPPAAKGPPPKVAPPPPKKAPPKPV